MLMLTVALECQETAKAVYVYNNSKKCCFSKKNIYIIKFRIFVHQSRLFNVVFKRKCYFINFII